MFRASRDRSTEGAFLTAVIMCSAVTATPQARHFSGSGWVFRHRRRGSGNLRSLLVSRRRQRSRKSGQSGFRCATKGRWRTASAVEGGSPRHCRGLPRVPTQKNHSAAGAEAQPEIERGARLIVVSRRRRVVVGRGRRRRVVIPWGRRVVVTRR